MEMDTHGSSFLRRTFLARVFLRLPTSVGPAMNADAMPIFVKPVQRECEVDTSTFR